jgi:hypothetical protein
MTQPNATRARRPVEPPTAADPKPAVGHDEARHAVGWIAFSALLLALVGALNGIYGTAAIATSDFYVKDAQYVLGNLAAHGWVMLVIGVVQFCAAVGILAFAPWARWVGVASAAVNAIVQMLVMPAAPFLAGTLLAMDVLIVYGLVTYGDRWRET